MFWRILSYMAGALATLSLVASPALAQQQQRISFVRDAEVEATIRTYGAPVFVAAGLNPNDVKIHLVNDTTLNAFVANGLNMFMNTGLLIKAENASQVIGVMAHETGHISGGHLARFNEGAQNAFYESLLAMVVMGAAGLAAGKSRQSGDAIMSGVLVGQQAGMRSLLQFSREIESSADQAGVNFLERSGQSAQGLLEFMQTLESQELLVADRQDPYVRTHPITAERVSFLRNFVARSRTTNAKLPAYYDELHRRMRAKLLGFTNPARALQVYKENDPSLEARYGRAIAYSRRPDYPRALALADDLLRERPDDAYFLETKAQMLLEAGRVAESVPFYEKAVPALPNESLLRTELGQAQIESGKPELIKPAIANLERARQQDSELGEAWRLLAIAYARDNNNAMAALSQAELSSLQRQRPEARNFAERAQKLLPTNSPAWQRAEDIKNTNDPQRKSDPN